MSSGPSRPMVTSGSSMLQESLGTLLEITMSWGGCPLPLDVGLSPGRAAGPGETSFFPVSAVSRASCSSSPSCGTGCGATVSTTSPSSCSAIW